MYFYISTLHIFRYIYVIIYLKASTYSILNIYIYYIIYGQFVNVQTVFVSFDQPSYYRTPASSQHFCVSKFMH